MRAIWILTFAASILGAQTAQTTAVITGKLLDAKTAKPVPAAWVIANRKTAPPLSKHTKSGGDGSFQIQGLTAGAYSLCVQTPSEQYLDPCGLGGSPAAVTVATGQTVNAGSVHVSPASLLVVHVQDAAGLLTQLTSAGRHPDLALGVRGPNGMFYPAHPQGGKLVAASVAGQTKSYTYQVAVPFDTAMSVSIASRDLTLGDANGMPLAAAASAQAFQHVTGAASFQSFTFSVVGLKP